MLSVLAGMGGVDRRPYSTLVAVHYGAGVHIATTVLGVAAPHAVLREKILACSVAGAASWRRGWGRSVQQLLSFIHNNYSSPPPKIPSADSYPGLLETFNPGQSARSYPNSNW